MPYKVAISGMYKRTLFTLVLPENGKPLMLDNICYFIGFNEKPFAQIALYLLKHDYTQKFLNAIIFPNFKNFTFYRNLLFLFIFTLTIIQFAIKKAKTIIHSSMNSGNASCKLPPITLIFNMPIMPAVLGNR